jgi:hypothetical protein
MHYLDLLDVGRRIPALVVYAFEVTQVLLDRIERLD